MRTKFFLFALPCFILTACGGSADKEAAKKINDSIAATHRFDSMQNAIKIMRTQDSIDANKAADSTKGQK